VFARFFAHIEQKKLSKRRLLAFLLAFLLEKASKPKILFARNGRVSKHVCSLFAHKFYQYIYIILIMDDSDMDVFSEFLHGSDEDDYEDDDYSHPQVQIGDGPPSERIGERRETSSQSNYLHLKVCFYII
jgi:hypothetical protein